MGVTGASVVEVFFDADCGLCSRSVEWLGARTGPEVVYRTSAELADLGLVDLSHSMVLVRSGDDVVAGSEAVAALLTRSRRPWPVIGRALRLPVISGSAALVYRWIAANRATISRRLRLDGQCALPGVPGVTN